MPRGGVGTFAVQLAKAYGAEVTGVCGPAKTDLVGSLGADRVLDHIRDDIGGPYELILDIGGCRPLPVLRRALTARGTAVIVGGENGGRWLGGADRQLRAIATAPVSRWKIKVFIAKENGKDVAALAELMAAGTVRTAVDRTYSLGEVPEAIRRLHAGHARGKIVITV